MNKLLLTLLSIALIGSAYAGDVKGEKAKKPKKAKLTAGMYAEINTTKGLITLKLEFEKTPMTVANFVGLAEGSFKVDTNIYDTPFYDSVKFHRVIKDFMIQGGDPQGNGSGGPDHRMFDETRKDLKHSGPGILSMANSDPQGSKKPYSNTGNSNGSQFFITHKATPHLDGLHTVFGHVISGQNVVNKIEQGDVMLTVTIVRVGKAAKNFDATAVFKKHAHYKTPEGQKELVADNAAKIKEQSAELESLKKSSAATTKAKKKAKIDAQIKTLEVSIKEMTEQNAEIEAIIAENAQAAIEKAYMDKVSVMTPAEFNTFFLSEVQKTFPNAKQTSSGLVYVIEDAGSGDKPVSGSKMSVHCTGNFRRDGSKFFSTKDAPGKPMEFKYKLDRMVPGWEEGLAMLGAGGKAKFFLPFHLAYGAQGRKGAIPPFADLIFTTEVIKVGTPEVLPEPVPVEPGHEGHDHGHEGHDHN